MISLSLAFFQVTSIGGPSLRTRSWKPSAAWSSRGRCRARVCPPCRCRPYTEVRHARRSSKTDRVCNFARSGFSQIWRRRRASLPRPSCSPLLTALGTFTRIRVSQHCPREDREQARPEAAGGPAPARTKTRWSGEIHTRLRPGQVCGGWAGPPPG